MTVLLSQSFQPRAFPKQKSPPQKTPSRCNRRSVSGALAAPASVLARQRRDRAAAPASTNSVVEYELDVIGSKRGAHDNTPAGPVLTPALSVSATSTRG